MYMIASDRWGRRQRSVDVRVETEAFREAARRSCEPRNTKQYHTPAPEKEGIPRFTQWTNESSWANKKGPPTAQSTKQHVPGRSRVGGS